ncbi:hypothetical protein EV360DRAFT_73688 [Lentinula raphanica]|nr:hypothetical protein EV360DRAFT_73688 [Lentinula raphanica]
MTQTDIGFVLIEDFVFIEDTTLDEDFDHAEDFVLVDHPPTKSHRRSWEPNASIERQPLREKPISIPSFPNVISPFHSEPLSGSDDEMDAELCDNLSEDWAHPSSESVVFTSTNAYISGYIDDSPDMPYHEMPAKVVVAKFSSNSGKQDSLLFWILVGPLQSVMPMLIVAAGYCNLDSARFECKIQRQIFLVHDLSSDVENVRSDLTICFMPDEMKDLRRALDPESLHSPAIIPDWAIWLSVIHEFKQL